MSATLPHNPTARDIIARSMLLHPSLFREAMDSLAKVHRDFAAQTYNNAAAKAARDLSDACKMVSTLIYDGNIDSIMESLRYSIPALSAAGKLQCLPRHMITDAARFMEKENT